MEERIKIIEGELEAIKARNAHVETDKAWETSMFRISFIAVLTYAIAAIVLLVIENSAPFRNALIPSIGYLLSTQSIPFLKRRWMQK